MACHVHLPGLAHTSHSHAPPQVVRHNELCFKCKCRSGGGGGVNKCLNCTLVWHKECIDPTFHTEGGLHMCPDCTYEQVEATSEASRWAAYLKTKPRLPPKTLRASEFLKVPKVEKIDRSDSQCNSCGFGGELLCCSYCPHVWHLGCCELADVPKGKWYCPTCVQRKPQKKLEAPNPVLVPTSHPLPRKEVELSGPRTTKRKRQRSAQSGSGLLDTVPSDLTFKQQMELALAQSKRDAERQERRARELGTTAQPEKPHGRGHKRPLPQEKFASHDVTSGPSESPPPTSDLVFEDFVIKEASEIEELGDFSIMCSDQPVVCAAVD
jgi:hypothetical protein